MTPTTDAKAAEAIRNHHAEMAAELSQRVNELLDAVSRGADHTHQRARVLDYYNGQVLPHAAAEEAALYPAGDVGASALLVRAMRAEHVNLVEHVASLGRTATAIEAVAIASSSLALFESHLAKENDLLVPTLEANPEVSLAELLGGMHELVG
jgi:hypothetical protein